MTPGLIALTLMLLGAGSSFGVYYPAQQLLQQEPIVKHISDKDLPAAILLQREKNRVVFTFRNLDAVTAGDRFSLVLLDEEPGRLKTDLLLDPLGRNSFVATVFQPGSFTIAYRGVKTVFEVAAPEIPEFSELIGLANYALPYCGPEFDPYQFVDLLAENGFNHTRFVMPSRAWLADASRRPSPFIKTSDKFDLRKYDEEFLNRLQALLYYALQRQVIVQVDIFDEVILHQAEFWRRSEWAPENNINGWFEFAVIQGEETSSREAFYEAVGRRRPEAALRTLERFFNTISNRVPPPHLIGDGNELESLIFSHYFLSRYDGPNALACGMSSLWNPGAGEHGQNPFGDDKHAEIFSAIKYINIHSVNPTSLEERFHFIEPLLQRYSHLKVIFSTDGAGSGSTGRRPLGERPNADDIIQIVARGRELAGDHFGGVEVKVLSWEDFKALLSQLSGKITLKK